MTKLAANYVRKWINTRPKIAIDFDGTIVHHAYPHIGEPVAGAFEWMKRFVELEGDLILWTIRCDDMKDGPVLTAAVDYCREQGVEFATVNESKGQRHWSSSNKIHAEVYIDDAAAGCPIFPADLQTGARPYANWRDIGPEVESLLVMRLLALGRKPVPRSVELNGLLFSQDS